MSILKSSSSLHSKDNSNSFFSSFSFRLFVSSHEYTHLEEEEYLLLLQIHQILSLFDALLLFSFIFF